MEKSKKTQVFSFQITVNLVCVCLKEKQTGLYCEYQKGRLGHLMLSAIDAMSYLKL